MTDAVGVIQQFFWQAFGISSENFWPALGGGIIASAVVFFFIHLVLSKITENDTSKEGLVNGVSLIFAIATLIYVWYSGVWSLMIGFTTFIILFGLLIFFIILWTIFRKHRAEHVRSKKEIYEARKLERQAKIDMRAGEIEKLLEVEENLNKRKELLTQGMIINLTNALKEKDFNKKAKYLTIAENDLVSWYKIVYYEYKNLRFIRDYKLARLLRGELKLLEEMKGDLDSARKALSEKNTEEFKRHVEKVIKLAKKEKKIERIEDKRIEKEEAEEKSEEVEQLKKILEEIKKYNKNPTASYWNKNVSPLIDEWDKKHPNKKIRYKKGMIVTDIVFRIKDLIKEVK